MFIPASPVTSFRRVADFWFGGRESPEPGARLFRGVGSHGIFWFERGRTALLHALRSVRLEPSDWALLPAYLCPAVLVPFRESKIPYEFYPVGRDLRVDLGGVAAAVARRGPPRVALAIHYFGFPADVVGLAGRASGGGGGDDAKASSHGLVVIEDCAHDLFGRVGDAPLGGRGDLAVFSLGKSLPLVEGGVLAVNSGRIPVLPPRQGTPSTFGDLKGTAKALWYRLETLLGWSPRSLLLSLDWLRLEAYKRDERQPMDTARSVSGRVRRWCARVDAEAAVARRRSNYAHCAERLRGHPGVTLLREDLPPGVCPIGLPVAVEGRDAVRRRCYRRGLALRAFWDVLPPEVLEWEGRTGNAEASFLRDRIALLPIHEDLGRREVDRALRVFLEELGRSRKGAGRTT